MEDRRLKILFGRSGSGSISPRISLPMSWIKDMGLNETDKEVIIEYEDEKITIKKERT